MRMGRDMEWARRVTLKANVSQDKVDKMLALVRR